MIFNTYVCPAKLAKICKHQCKQPLTCHVSDMACSDTGVTSTMNGRITRDWRPSVCNVNFCAGLCRLTASEYNAITRKRYVVSEH